MIGYAETNFVLELALGQEGAADAIVILEEAGRGRLNLAIPSFALCEPYGTVTRRARQRNQSFSLEHQLRELQRNPANHELVENLRVDLARALELDRREMDELERIVGDLLRCARVLPLTTGTHELSLHLQSEHDLDPSDALIAAAILEDARDQEDDEKFFVTRNSKHFDFPAIHERFHAERCELVFSFADVRDRLGA